MNLLNKKTITKFTALAVLVFTSVFCAYTFAGADTFAIKNTLKFAQISDVHLSDKTVDTSYKLLASSRELFDDELWQINHTPNLDFVFVTGDMTDRSKEPMIMEFISKMNKLKYPWYSAFGNHDISIGGEINKKKYVSILKKHNKNYKFDNSYYSFTPKKGFRVIAMDAIIDNMITANGKVPQEQLEWLDKELAKSQKNGEIPLIFLHNPLHEPFSSFHHKILNSDEFDAVLHKYSMPMAIFSGHYHSTKIFKEGNILHVSTPSLVSYPNAFRIVTVTDTKDKVIFSFVFKETNLKELQKKAKLLTFSSKNYYGEESDRNTTVAIDKKP